MPQSPKTIRHRRASRPPNEARPHSGERGYDQRWKRFRLDWLHRQFVSGNVMCAWCGRILDGASRDIHVDHRIPHRGDPALMYDEANLQALHAACHSRKTAQEDGGFGRAPAGAK